MLNGVCLIAELGSWRGTLHTRHGGKFVDPSYFRLIIYVFVFVHAILKIRHVRLSLSVYVA